MDAPRKRRRSRVPLWQGFLQSITPALTGEELAHFRGKRILITGAGGFLGSALARRLARASVAHLALLDTAEHGLYRLDQTLGSFSRTLVVGSVNDRLLLRNLFHAGRPDIVFHAAARKHVPLMETNALAAAEANILGTLALVETARDAAHMPTVLLLSTDKAVEPISIMGATKRVAEQIVLAARQQPAGHVFQALRLCNVLGSTGSVAPLFARQIITGKPLTITDPEATRFFVSTRDAVQHLLRAASTPASTGLLIPELYKAHRVADLARYMLGRASQPDTHFTYTGLRPADKLHEQLLSPGEHTLPGSSPRLNEVTSPFQADTLPAIIPQIEQAVATRNLPQLLQAVEQAVPAYRARVTAPEDLA